jgi:hypothetical protein
MHDWLLAKDFLALCGPKNRRLVGYNGKKITSYHGSQSSRDARKTWLEKNAQFGPFPTGQL